LSLPWTPPDGAFAFGCFAYLSRGRVAALTEVRVAGEEMRPP
jgi:hypothetical protein